MADPSELQVRGGIGGVQALLEDVDRAGLLLRTAAGELADHARAVLAVSGDPGLQRTAALSPLTFARAEAALAGAALGRGGLFALAARTEGLSLGALTAARGYRIADDAVTGTLQAAASRLGQAIGMAGGVLAPVLFPVPAVVVSVLARRDAGGSSAASPRTQLEPLRRISGVLLRWLADHPTATGVAAPVLSGVIGGFWATVPGGPLITASVLSRPGEPATVAEIANGLQAFGGPAGAVTGGPRWLCDQRQFRVRVAAAPRYQPPRDLAGLLGRIPGETDHPSVHVERIDSATGRRWVVSVPGTADWSPVASRTPFDLTGDVRLLAAGRSTGTAAVMAAMRATGVRPGEPVLLVGHSQGGLIAAAVAADPMVRREFAISHVLTSGAPVASVPVPDQVQVLSIEHTDDLVPRLDGSANRDRPNWVTVSTAAPTTELPAADRAEPLAAHRLELYRRTAQRIDESSDPSIVRWRAGLAPFLDRASGPNSVGVGSGAGWDVEITRADAS